MRGQRVLSSNQNTVFTDIWDSELPISQGPDFARVTFRLKEKLWMLESVLYIAQHQSKKKKEKKDCISNRILHHSEKKKIVCMYVYVYVY